MRELYQNCPSRGNGKVTRIGQRNRRRRRLGQQTGYDTNCRFGDGLAGISTSSSTWSRNSVRAA